MLKMQTTGCQSQVQTMQTKKTLSLSVSGSPRNPDQAHVIEGQGGRAKEGNTELF